MTGMALTAAMEGACVRGLGTSSSIVGGFHSFVPGNASQCLPVLRINSLKQVEGSLMAVRSTDCQSRIGFRRAQGLRPTVCHVVCSAVADLPTAPTKPVEFYTVGDFMTPIKELFCVRPETTVDEALEILVEKRITGLPVVDEEGKLVGVVSDYDLLALDSISGKRSDQNNLFPAANSTWKAFKEIQTLLGKTHGKTVAELMSSAPLVVREMTNIEDAARILLETKYRRLPVVSEEGKLVGLLTRGNVVKAALEMKRKSVQS